MNADQIKAIIFALPEFSAWPEMAAVFARTNGSLSREWELPWLACQAVGGTVEAALPGAAALACIQLSIVLVDDMLDDDPRGDYHHLGYGPTANLALAYQAAAFALVKSAPVDGEGRAGLAGWLAHIGLGTALGQYHDAHNAGDEAAYWQVVRGKSGPFYGAALAMGALLGGASQDVIERLNDLGILLGETSQIFDDLSDALRSPARPDWQHGRNNLLILYALTANYADRARFEACLPQVEDPAILREAQQILLSCGAVSYCALQAARRYRAAQQLLASLPLINPEPLAEGLRRQCRPLEALFEAAGAALPAELLDG
jgi:geranylgeranyl diphosphate synthase, type I